MRRKNLINFLLLIFWVISLLFVSLWTYENPENVEIIKSYLKKNRKPDVTITNEDSIEILANSYSVQISKVISLSEKTLNKNFLFAIDFLILKLLIISTPIPRVFIFI